METKITPHTPQSQPPIPIGAALSGAICAGLQGDFGEESSRIPFLSIGQKSSDITETNPLALGALVYAGKHLVPRPVTMSIFGGKMLYRQNLTFDRLNARAAKRFGTKEQVLAAGGNVERFVKAGADDSNYVPEMTCSVALFAPKSRGKLVCWADTPEVLKHSDSNGVWIIPVLWPLRGVGYGEVVPNLRMIERALREDGKELGYARFELSTAKRTFSANSTHVPVISRLPEDNSPETVALLHNIFGV